MATKAIIAKLVENIELGVFDASLYDQLYDRHFNMIQVNSDGYPDNIVPRLTEILKSYDIEFIMAQGNIRSLKSKYEPNPLGYHSTDYPQSDVSIVYSRDIKNESFDKAKLEMKTIKMRERKEHYPYTDYVYVVDKNNKIFCSSNIHEELKFMEGCDFKEE